MKSARGSKIATLMVHSSPLDQAGMGDAGGMNVYVVETAKKMAQAGVSVDIFIGSVLSYSGDAEKSALLYDARSYGIFESFNQ